MAAPYAPTGTIEDIVPEVRPRFEELLRVAAELGMEPHVRSAGRTCGQQNAQQQGGYSHAGGCRSWHTVGRALDIDLHPQVFSTYEKLGHIWEDMGGFWGGRWTTLFPPYGDYGHFHWGEPEPTTQAVPLSICSGSGDCEAERSAYLDEAFAWQPPFSWAPLVAFAGAAVLGYALWGGRWSP